MSLETELITLKNGVKICAPADINLMTHYVLKEQGDWFEDEIHFVRDYVQADMNVLDIGANYGLYATTIAKNLQESGKLWCFEPTPNTADALRTTISENNFEDCVEIIQEGLSNQQGEATFYMSPNAELNSLTPEPGMEEVTITLNTLDDCAEKLEWPQIDFIKLDAEGEEINILKGGEGFFKQQSPVVMFELKHKTSVNMPLIDAFKDLGFSVYYLVPGLNVLAPFNADQHFDSFLLNLFAVKDDKVADLKARGFLVEMPDLTAVTGPDTLPEGFEAKACFEGMNLDFAGVGSLDEEYRKILFACAASRDESLDKQSRFDQLMVALELTKVVLKDGQKPFPGRLSTLARVAYDSGHRTVGNQILSFVFEKFIKPSKTFGIKEVFVPVTDEFESVASSGKTDGWFCSMVLDQIARKMAFSSFFGGAAETVKFVEVMEQLGFAQPDMKRRSELVKERLAATQ